MRVHLVEIHDLPSCPPSLRDALTDFLAFTANLAGAYDPVAPLLRRAVARTGAHRIIDLCSGAGGPWRTLAAQVGVPVVLTDRYPHGDNVVRVDARAVPAELDGFRTMFTAFHHFRPPEARAILADAVQRRQGIGVFEIARRAPLSPRCRSFARGAGRGCSGPICRPPCPSSARSTASSPACGPIPKPSWPSWSGGVSWTSTTGTSEIFEAGGHRCGGVT